MSPLKRSTNIAARMGRWSARHRKIAIFGWLAFVIASFAVGIAMPMKTIDENDFNVGEARKADHIIRDAGFKVDEQMEYVLVQSETATASDPAFRAVVNDAITTLDGFKQVEKLRSPFAAGNEGQISAGRPFGADPVQPQGTYEETVAYIDTVTASVAKLQKANPDFVVVEAGSASTGKALDEMFGSQLARAGLVSIPLTLIILLVVFGSLVGATIPLLLALSSVFATIGLVALPSQIVPMDESVAEVILLIGLAVGVDYSLFYIRRERDERRAGRSEQAALEAAAATSGRAVLISGFTVMIAMAGMFFSGDKTFMSFAIGTMIVVGVAMVGSLTVLPAMLSWLGDRVDKVKVPFLWRLRRDGGEGRVWGAILDRVLRRPLISALASAAVLVALAAPAVTLHTSNTGLDALPKSLKEVQDYNKIEAAFPGGSTPAIVAISGDASDPKLRPGSDRSVREGARVREGPRADPCRRRTERVGGHGVDPARRQRHRQHLGRGTRRPPRARSCRQRSGRSPASTTRSPARWRPPGTGTTR